MTELVGFITQPLSVIFQGSQEWCQRISDGKRSELSKGGICSFRKVCTIEFNFDPRQTLTWVIKELDWNRFKTEAEISKSQHKFVYNKPHHTNIISYSFLSWKVIKNHQVVPEALNLSAGIWAKFLMVRWIDKEEMMSSWVKAQLGNPLYPESTEWLSQVIQRKVYSTRCLWSFCGDWFC